MNWKNFSYLPGEEKGIGEGERERGREGERDKQTDRQGVREREKKETIVCGKLQENIFKKIWRL